MTEADPQGQPPEQVESELVAGLDLPMVASFGDDPDAGGLDLGSLLAAAGEMQTQLAAAQEQAAAQELEGVAGGGAVRITVTGGGEFRRVQIAPEAVDPSEIEMLCDLVLAALHDATTKVQQVQASSMGGLGGLLDGGGLGDLFGGSGPA